MSAVDDIKKARAIIERGWHKGDYHNEDGTAYCIVGALELVDSQTLYGHTAAEEAITETIRRAYPELEARAIIDRRRVASYFNDYLARSKQDVLDLLDKTLADLGGLA